MAMEEDSDNDSIEVLLTISPLSPFGKQRKDVTPENASTPNPTVVGRQPVQGTIKDPHIDWEKSYNHTSHERLEESSLPLIDVSCNDATRRPQFSHRSSAYLQSLAEICHGILWDVRWRVGGSRQERLLRWERGEDLSAVLALARRYLSPSSQQNPSPNQHSLNHNSVKREDMTDGDEMRNHLLIDRYEDLQTSLRDNGMPIADDADDDYDRALNLYARLYARKGPWFRVDDVFKYYTPKQSKESTISPKDATTPTAATPKVASPSKFFVPKIAKKRSPSVGSSTPSTDCRYIDHEYVKKELLCVSTFLQDLKQLYGMGLARSFQSEEECGQTIGEIQTYGLLKQEEQQAILARLGGGKNKTEPKRDSIGENKIWKQMRQQQSIMATQKNSGSTLETMVLPVAKHVDQAIITSWASAIVLRASRGNYVPHAIFRKTKAPIQQQIEDMVKKYLGSFCSSNGISLTCLRLREGPLFTLQRCCRLYLCASSGPGEMRGDTGTNAWKTLPGEVKIGSGTKLFPSQVVSPPCSPNWRNTVYPGRDFRFKLISCPFQRACVPWPVQQVSMQSLSDEALRRVQVFSSTDAFRLWEQSVIIRATVDYLVEANAMILYTERKRAREEAAEGIYDSSFRRRNGNAEDLNEVGNSPMDFLGVLHVDARQRLLRRFTSFISGDEHLLLEVDERLETDTNELLSRKCVLKTDCEHVLCVIGAMVTQILRFQNEVSSRKGQSIAERPWLRHLWWEGCLSYLLWDIIPTFEQRGFYQLATTSLEVLLFGRALPRNASYQSIPKTLVPDKDTFRTQAYLSRRARGKAFDRLVIDHLHTLRQQQKENSKVHCDQKKRKRKRETVTSPEVPSPNELIADLCLELLQTMAPNAHISFCAVRTLARRIKQPLSSTLDGLALFEVCELGHRYANPAAPPSPAKASGQGKAASNKYSDWRPITDHAVANAMLPDDGAAGGRCSYIGFEDIGDSPTSNFRSLNVEELAMEYYNSGRLPGNQDPDVVKGGWTGWHDEGGKLRTLFRILASNAILGSDWECTAFDFNSVENATIHLTPYQGAPFDLHVGAELGGIHDGSRLGFYRRRRQLIDEFLGRLFGMSPEQVADLVYQSIQTRRSYAKEYNQTDPVVALDIHQTRTLCAMAAGFGGRMLAAFCRCLFFDYRHYSGGLPDLTLFRALYESNESNPEESLVDLGLWIGESFSPDQLAENEGKRAARMLEDQDEEFLGCSKVGDSARGNTGGRRTGSTRAFGGRSVASSANHQPEMPEPLEFQLNGRKIRVECMLVEVKSHNDRLDSRQEDWLNILDYYGNVRVCKFESKQSPQRLQRRKDFDNKQVADDDHREPHENDPEAKDHLVYR